MGLRFFKRIKIAPGVTLNLSKSGVSVSLGPRGAKLTVGPRGTHVTAGIPGTGLYYTTKLKKKKKKKSDSPKRMYFKEVSVPSENPLELSFWDKLMIDSEEREFVEGCKLYSENKIEEAMRYFQESDLIDAKYFLGYLYLKREDFDNAEKNLQLVLNQPDLLGKFFIKYNLQFNLIFPISKEIYVYAEPDIVTVILLLVEIYQDQERWEEAIQLLQKATEIDPYDPVIRLSFVELMFDFSTRSSKSKEELLKRIVEITENVNPEDYITGGLVFYKGKAFLELGLSELAKKEFSKILRKKKKLPKELVVATFYERAKSYEQLGQKSKSLKDYQEVYSRDPDYEDVKERLNLSSI